MKTWTVRIKNGEEYRIITFVDVQSILGDYPIIKEKFFEIFRGIVESFPVGENLVEEVVNPDEKNLSDKAWWSIELDDFSDFPFSIIFLIHEDPFAVPDRRGICVGVAPESFADYLKQEHQQNKYVLFEFLALPLRNPAENVKVHVSSVVAKY
ncbi:MAG: hypothetical protein ACFE7E_06325 [Candidatus Hodarchaeota archaeon]